MSERTGATESQIEAAIRRRLASMYNDDEITDALVADCGSFYYELFACFVRPDQRIVDVADLRTCFVRTAVPAIEWLDAANRLREAIGDE